MLKRPTKPGYATDAELVAAPPLPVDAAYVRKVIETEEAREDRLHGRWTLSLAVGNGGALVMLGGKVLEALSSAPSDFSRVALALAFPSLWLFAIGLACAGLIPLASLWLTRMELERHRHGLRYLIANSDVQADVTEDPDPPMVSVIRWGPELASSVCFLAGLVYPLAVLSIRYFADGTFRW